MKIIEKLEWTAADSLKYFWTFPIISVFSGFGVYLFGVLMGGNVWIAQLVGLYFASLVSFVLIYQDIIQIRAMETVGTQKHRQNRH
jgi:hypothetical protein